MTRWVFDGPGARPEFCWYVNDVEYRYGDELPASVMEGAEARAVAAREALPGLRADLDAIEIDMAAKFLDETEVYDLVVKRDKLRVKINLAEDAIARAENLRVIMIDAPDSLLRRGIIRPLDAPCSDSAGAGSDVPTADGSKPTRKRAAKARISEESEL